MIIDCHAHYTSEPKAFHDFRQQQVKAVDAGIPWPTRRDLHVSDDQIRELLEPAQIRMQRERGIDVTIFSPRASAMGHHVGGPELSLEWTQICNDTIKRIVDLYPNDFIGAAQLPQSKGVDPRNVVRELERCVNELGFVGCNLNPDPSGGYFDSPPLSDKWWYPVYEKLCELRIPAMIHVTGSCNPAQHTTAVYYINGDTMAFFQLIMSDVFKDFPDLKVIIPHGGGAIPYHWGRYRGIAFMNKRPELLEIMAQNIFFDTCVYHQKGIDLLTDIVPADNILFASELVGAVKGVDPQTGFEFDFTRRYVDAAPISDGAKRKIFSENALRVFPRLGDRIAAQRRG